MTTASTRARIVQSTDGTAISYQTLGAGPGFLVVGGAWRSAHDYLPFAKALAPFFAVHVVDRRGRGGSGPQGDSYSIECELEDLFAVQAQTEATMLFGHSYGGLIALEVARRSRAFTDVIVYEPAVSIAGSIPLAWMTPYRSLLEAGDRRGAFAAMVRAAGGAPPLLERMPLWYVNLILRLVMRQSSWRRIDPLLEAAIGEHQQVAALDEPNVDRYQTISARTVLLGGSKSRPHLTRFPFDLLSAAISDCTVDIIAGLDHLAPDDNAPGRVAERVRQDLIGTRG